MQDDDLAVNLALVISVFDLMGTMASGFTEQILQQLRIGFMCSVVDQAMVILQVGKYAPDLCICCPHRTHRTQ